MPNAPNAPEDNDPFVMLGNYGSMMRESLLPSNDYPKHRRLKVLLLTASHNLALGEGGIYHDSHSHARRSLRGDTPFLLFFENKILVHQERLLKWGELIHSQTTHPKDVIARLQLLAALAHLHDQPAEVGAENGRHFGGEEARLGHELVTGDLGLVTIYEDCIWIDARTWG